MSCEKKDCVMCKVIQAFADPASPPLSIDLHGQEFTMENPAQDMSLASLFLSGQYGDAGAKKFLCAHHDAVYTFICKINSVPR